MGKRKHSLVLSFLLGFIFASMTVSAEEAVLGEEHYQIYSTARNTLVAIDDIVGDLEDFDIIIFGEEHNDSVGHYLEYLLFRKLHERYGDALVLSLEMFDRDVQVVLDEYLAGKIEARHFEKDARIWTNYRDYRPLVEYAKEHGIEIIAANAPFRYIHMANEHGQEYLGGLSDEAKRFIAPLPYDTIEGAYREKLVGLMMEIPEKRKEAMESRTPEEMKKMPKMPSLNIIQGQSLWNATMARSMSEYLGGHPGKKVLHVNGRMHSDEHFGVPEQLRFYLPDAKHLLISEFPDDAFPETDFSRYEHLADYVIVTDPEVPRTFEQ
jgi:uncharacterized iron-regulated protein